MKAVLDLLRGFGLFYCHSFSTYGLMIEFFGKQIASGTLPSTGELIAGMNQQNRQGVHVAIEIADLDLAVSIKAKLRGSSQPLSGSHCSIYKVHEKFRKINKYAYTPEMVAVGPYHHEERCLLEMEKYKLRYANAFFTRTRKSVEECVQAIRILEKDIRKCYSEPVDLDSDQFVEMMLVDGLFIIELFRRSAKEVEIDTNDPIFSNIWSMSSLIRDMILLENQIPMLVLDKLFEVPSVKEDGKISTTSFSMLALSFFNPLMPREKEVLEKYSKYHGKHLLDLIGNTFQALPQGAVDHKNRTCKWKFVPCVTELRRAGVKFKKGDPTGSFLDIKFSIHGVLEIPQVIIQDQTDSLLRNLIASEQCCDGYATHMTSYAFFMDSLINSPEDVGFLRDQGIIRNYLGHDEDVSNMFNKLCSEVTLVNFYYFDLCEQVNTYYKTRWHRWRATLKRDYFNNPWTTVSFLAAILLLLLTLIQAIFSILSYTKSTGPARGPGT